MKSGIVVKALLAAAALVLLFPFVPARADLTDELKACGLTRGPQEVVVEIVDGDTVLLKSGYEVRLVGIQAPKLPLGRNDFEAWPLADEAKASLSALVLHAPVRLYYGTTRKDRYGRALAHVVTLNEAENPQDWAQRHLLEAGLARVYTFSDNRLCASDLYASEKKARAAEQAMWADPFYKVLGHYETWPHLDSFQLVTGRVLDAAEVSSGVYLNFEENWREDFTIFIAKRDVRRFEGGAQELLELEDRQVRVRGWLKLRNGPMIVVTHPEQLEVLKGKQ